MFFVSEHLTKYGNRKGSKFVLCDVNSTATVGWCISYVVNIKVSDVYKTEESVWNRA
jgi:hypothetical protein